MIMQGLVGLVWIWLLAYVNSGRFSPAAHDHHSSASRFFAFWGLPLNADSFHHNPILVHFQIFVFCFVESLSLLSVIQNAPLPLQKLDAFFWIISFFLVRIVFKQKIFKFGRYLWTESCVTYWIFGKWLKFWVCASFSSD
ncbi:hypothetical protein AB3S75_008732 [Citrus x aurantiifolia]